MKSLLLVPALLLSVLPAFAGAQETTEHVTRTLALRPGGTLELKSFSGQVRITASDRPEVVIDAVRYGTRARLDRITLDIHADGSNAIVVDANRRASSWFDSWGRNSNSVIRTDFEIKVPRQTNLDISVFSAPVTVVGVEGSHKVHGFSSRLQFEDVEGPVQAHTFSGAVTIRERSWAADQSIEVDTFSGDVDLRVPEGAHGDLTFNSFSGRLDSNVPLTFHSSSRRSVKAQLGNGGGSLRFKTFSGSVRIDR